ncbi:acetyl-CoA synthetase-like protein [Linderina pennispora]|uniref:Acetyl-CoA synthetase-like protein n=1 Tax=Linderina pennispora TaxID=61395 RepID=A0A1Y1W176_9FUNG|nr:acetyl-CoA synthetase-like protein [Linderina pennispora]ORX67289.1 acetyl-CoA synthetase-like protein [Linderina pennispora]
MSKWPQRNFIGMRTFNVRTQAFGRYEWKTYAEGRELLDSFGSGLEHVFSKYVSTESARSAQALGIYATNRSEWMLAEFGGFRSRKYSVALYDTLGAESVEYILNHAEVSVVVCSIDKIPRLLRLKDKIPCLKAIVCMDTFATHARNPAAMPFTINSVRVLHEWAESKGVALLDVDQVTAMGRAEPTQPEPPKPSDICTVQPEGAISTHAGYTYSAKAAYHSTPTDGCVYLSFLPLAHCYERNINYVGLLGGGAVGYYSGDVLRIAEDAQALQPTIMIGVPRLFNRIYDRITAATIYAPGIAGMIARTAISQKLKKLKQPGGTVTHAFWDRVVCRKIAQFFGGKLEFMISGSAPIDAKVLSFLRVAIACPILEGYGQTEGNATATVCLMEENTAGHVGVPLPGVDIRLRDCPEMSYLSTDPNPRGELLVYGPHVFAGYLHDDASTAATIENGWLLTGDIGEFLPDGNIRIIDRRKNIFKLAQGEYVAPEHLENVYTKQPLVQQVYTFLPWAHKLVGNKEATLEELCKDAQVVGALLVELVQLGRKSKLQGFEIIKAVFVEPVPFDIETNALLTSTFKLKRNVACDYYRAQIDEMYQKITAKK